MEPFYICLISVLSSKTVLGSLLVFFIFTTIVLSLALIHSHKKNKINKEKDEYWKFCLDILDNLPFPIFVKDINDDFKYKLWNKEAEKQSGTDRKDIIGKCDFDIYGEERGFKYRTVDKLLIKSGKKTYRAEDDYVTPDGITHNTIVFKSVVSSGDSNWLLIVRWDITQMKEYEEKLIRINEKLEDALRNQNLVLNSINFGLVYIDNNYEVQWESTANISNIAKDKRYVPGEICYKTVMNRETPCQHCALSETIQKGMPIRHEWKEGNTTVEVSAIPILDTEGKETIGGLMKIEDISDKKRIEHLLYEMKKAEEANNLKSAFLANMSHEIRTPLNAIVGFSTLLAETDDPDEKQEFIHIITTNNDLLLQLINDIIDMAKIESGSVNLTYMETDLDELMTDIECQMKLKNLRAGTVNIEFIRNQQACILETDRIRLMQILTNLLVNAMKFTEKGHITFGYDKSEKEICFFVKDTGIGIPNDQKENIFARFVKLNNFAQGTGLGLPICSMLVEKMGGTIGVESELGKGSEFWFKLPVR